MNLPWEKSYWSWLDYTLIPSLYSKNKSDSVWQFASTMRIRQVRSLDGPCPADRYSSLLNITRCSGTDFDKNSYATDGWTVKSTRKGDNIASNAPWKYDRRCSSDHTVIGMLRNYPCEGYYFRLQKDITYKEHVQKLSSELKAKLWVDDQTRLLEHNVVLYNPDTNQYAFYNFLIESVESRFTSMTFSIDYFKADFYFTNLDRFSIFCVALLTLIMIFLSWTIVKMPFHHGLWNSFKRFWYVHLVLMVLVTLSSIILHVVTLIGLYRFQDDIHNGDVAAGSNVGEIVVLSKTSRYLFAISVFLVIIRVSNVLFIIFLVKFWIETFSC